MIRSFIALDVPIEVKKTISEMQADLRHRFPQSSITWTRSEGIHLTLQFLGDIYEQDVSQITEAVTMAAENVSPFSICTTFTGGFPNLRRPRVLWWGVNGGKELMALQKSIGQRLSQGGFPSDGKAFHPHLTVGRVKSLAPNSPLPEYFGQLSSNESENTKWQITDIKIMSSVLKPSGAVYSILEQVKL